jgi:phosphotransferase family enzyme
VREFHREGGGMRAGLAIVRDVAYWLSRRHTSEIGLEQARESLGVFSELSEQTSWAAAKHPKQLKMLVRMLESMEELIRTNRFDLLASSVPRKNVGPAPLTINGFSFELALQVLLSLCRNITGAESDSLPMEWTFDHYGREFERALPWVSAVATTEGRSEGSVGRGRSYFVRTRDMLEGRTESRFQEIDSPDFMRRVVYPAVSGEPPEAASPDCKASIVQEPGSGRTTVCYLFEGKPLVYGKLYSDEAEALHSNRLLKELWKRGFDNLSSYRVPEFLTYLPQYKLQLTRAVEGKPLSVLHQEQDPELTIHVRQAAHWLVKLHLSSLRIGRAETLWESMDLFRLIRRLSRAAASVPEQRNSMLEMVERLCGLGKQNFKAFPQVQTHGTFHNDHILIHGLEMTVMDFDRSVPSDPAKDLADFLKILRLKTFNLTGDTRLAEEPTKAFLQEYMRYLPENCGNLSIYWAAFTLVSLLRQARKCDPADEASKKKMRYLADEFDLALSGKLVPAPARGVEYAT